MKISTTTFAHKKLILTALAVVLIGVTTVTALEITGVTGFFKQDSSGYTGQTQTESEKQAEIEQNDKRDFIEESDPSIQPATAETSPSIDLSAKQESDNSVTVLTKLSAVPDGTCTLKISNGSKTYTQTAEVIYQPNFSSCAGFSVNREKLGTGEWIIKVAVTSDVTIEKTINFKVN